MATLSTRLAVPAVVALALATAAPAVADDGGRPFSTDLTGAAEVPGPGDPDGSGTVSMQINPGQGEICYTLTATGIEPAVAAHIHVGAADEAGPVVVALTPPTEGSSTDCAEVERDLASAIILNPDNYYVNVHNADFPGGAIRGQLGR